MLKEEARKWLSGERSTINEVCQEPLETWTVRVAQADAAMIEQAFWILKAHKEKKGC